MTFCWGLQDSMTNTQISEIAGFEFTLEEKTNAFGIFTFLQVISTFFFLLIEAYVESKPQLYVFHTLSGLLGLGLCSVTLYFPNNN